MSRSNFELVVALAMLAGCAGGGASPDDRPDRSAADVPEPTAARSPSAAGLPPAKEHEVRVDVYLRPKGSTKRTFWLYRPVPLPEELALVLMAPARSRMLSGRALSSDDRPEHLPYVRAGFAVMAYFLDGDMPPGASDAKATRALEAYKASRAGIENAQVALDLALEKLPRIDPSLVFAVGHGSAGAHALLLAAEQSRVKGVVAYAPVTRLTGDVGVVIAIDKGIPGYAKFLRWSIPENRAADVGAPLFIYQSKEDEVVRASHTHAYVESLRANDKPVDYLEVAAGDHYEGMLQDGIPRGLAWLRTKRGD